MSSIGLISKVSAVIDSTAQPALNAARNSSARTRRGPRSLAARSLEAHEVGSAARRAERRERLARARDRLAAEDQARREAQRAKQEAWDAAAAAGNRAAARPGDEPRGQPGRDRAAGEHH